MSEIDSRETWHSGLLLSAMSDAPCTASFDRQTSG
jgi:hypothetical protein